MSKDSTSDKKPFAGLLGRVGRQADLAFTDAPEFNVPLWRYNTLPSDLKQAVNAIVETNTRLRTENSQLKERVKQLDTEANIDELTGEANRRAILKKAQRMIYDHYKDQFDPATYQVDRKAIVPDTVIFLDCDYFKFVNDKIGYPAGDKILKQLSQTVSKTMEDGDFFGRYGGDEFVIILHQKTKDQADTYMQNLRKALLDNPCEIATSDLKGCTYMNDHEGKVEIPESIKIPVSVTYGAREIIGNDIQGLLDNTDKDLSALAHDTFSQFLKDCEEGKGTDKARPARDAHIRMMNNEFNNGEVWVDKRKNPQTPASSVPTSAR